MDRKADRIAYWVALTIATSDVNERMRINRSVVLVEKLCVSYREFAGYIVAERSRRMGL